MGKNFAVLDILFMGIYRELPPQLFFQISKLIFETLPWA
jgi:hypothetical protein